MSCLKCEKAEAQLKELNDDSLEELHDWEKTLARMFKAEAQIKRLSEVSPTVSELENRALDNRIAVLEAQLKAAREQIAALENKSAP